MWKVCQGVIAQPLKTTAMPQTVSVKVTNVSAQLPTHMLAVCQNSQAKAAIEQGAAIRYQLVPTHSIILAAHCAHLRALPQHTSDAPLNAELTLPIERLGVPHLESFRHIHEYLYTQNAEVFAMSMIPTSTARTPSDGKPNGAAAWAHRLARTFTYEVLVRQLEHTLGTWQNMVFLGIQDDRMWHALQASYFTIRSALLLQTRRGMAHS
jgi:hypothetical protein